MKNPILLFVDDQQVNLHLLQTLATRHFPECKVLTATCAEDGLKIAAETELAGIVCDVQMPGWDGVEMCRHLKAEESSAHIPVVLITAHWSSPEFRITALEAGADDFITRPIFNAELVMKIKVMLRIKEAENDLRAEKAALAASEESFKVLYEDAPDMYVTVDAARATIMRCNRTLAEKLGYRKDEIVGRPVFEIYHPDCREKVKDAFLSFVQTGEVHDTELQLKRKDGSRIEVSLSARAVRDEKGNALYSMSCLRDITARKHLEKALRDSEARYDLAVLGSNDGLWVWDILTDKEWWWSPRCYEILGYQEKEIEASFNSWVSRIHPGDHDRVLKAVDTHLNGGSPFNVDYRYLHKDMTYHWQNSCGQVSFDENGKPIRMAGFIRDIHERKTVERALEESEDRYRTLFEESPISIREEDYSGVKKYMDQLRASGVQDFRTFFDENPDEVLKCCKLIKITDVNRETLRLYKAKSKKELLAGMSKFINEEFLAHIRDELVSLAAGKTSFESEARVLNFAGETIDYLFRVTVVPGYEDSWAKVFVTDLDITARKQAEVVSLKSRERLRTLSHKLLTVQESERRHLARELHDEIGQSLTAIKIDMQTVRKFPDDVSVTQRLNESITGIDRILQGVRDLTLNLHPPMLDDLGLHAALRWWVKEEAHRAGLKGSYPAKDFDIGLSSSVQTGCFRFVQEAVTNVIRHARAQSVSVELLETPNGLCIIIRDDGIGFDVDTMHRLAEKGKSLGLLGMEERMRLVGGRIQINSEPGFGTEVRAWIPQTPVCGEAGAVSKQ